MGSWRLDNLEQAFADAAIDPTNWKKAMNVVASVCGGFGATLIPSTPMPEIPFSDRLIESNDIYFRERWYERDARYRSLPLLERNGVADDLDLFSDSEINKHPYYQEFLAPLGLRWFAGVRVAFGDDLWCLSIQRTIA